MRSSLVLLLSALGFGGICLADAPERWVPGRCLELLPADTKVESSWNEAYRRGFNAIGRDEYDVAELEMCQALLAARRLGPRDWRFAETLDELGLIAFTLRDFELAEQVQGAAIAEMLLAVGPHGEPFKGQEISEQSPVRPDCRSGIGVYTTRLGWIHERTPGRITTSDLESAPWRVFPAGYLPLDAQLAKRLDWLISRYLLEENLVAADELTDLQERILALEP